MRFEKKTQQLADLHMHPDAQQVAIEQRQTLLARRRSRPIKRPIKVFMWTSNWKCDRAKRLFMETVAMEMRWRLAMFVTK